MLSLQHSLFLRFSAVVVWRFILLMLEISSQTSGEKHPSQSPEFSALKPNQSFAVLHPHSVPEDARLARGGSLCSGRLEMKHQGEWRIMTFKDRDTIHNVRHADVACRQMGCGAVLSIAHRTNNTQQQPAWEVHFSCLGTESTLRECSSSKKQGRAQGKNASADSLEVICSESVRLVGMSDVCRGSVEVKTDQGWGSVCEDGFDSAAAMVVCRELGCGNLRWQFTKEGTVLSKQFKCEGNETRLEDCASSTRNDCTPASGVSCSIHHDVRLVGGENKCKGTLEGKYGREWRPLSDPSNFLKVENFGTICELVGCADVISSSISHLPKSQPVWELSTTCHDTSSLCKSWTGKGSTSVITLTCSEDVRLVGGRNRCWGKLEVKSGQTWATVCSSFFNVEAAAVTCRNLYCGLIRDYYGQSDYDNTEPVWGPVFECEGKEKHLRDCPSSLLNTTEEGLRECVDTHLHCNEQPRKPLMSVEFLHWLEPGQDLKTRKVIIKGHRFAISCQASSYYSILSFRLKSGVYTKNQVEQIQPAVGGEAVFIFPAAESAHQGTYQCDYNYNVSSEIFSEPSTIFLTLKDNKYVRLVNGGSRCAGSLEVEYQKVWRSVSYRHSWSLKEAAVLCRHLDCGSAVSTSKVDNSKELLPVWRFYSDCDGSEQALLDCGKVRKWHSSSIVEVVCSDILPQPKVSVYSTRELSQNERQDTLLFKGYSFTIKCSVKPQYPGGHFSLIFTGLNQTHSRTQLAVNHTAHFPYAAADEAHQGNYSCVYHNFVFNFNLTSESQSLSLMLNEIEDVMLDDGVARDYDFVVCAGRLYVYHEQFFMLSAESTVWDLKHASLVCRQLGCGSAVSTNVVNLPRKEYVLRLFSDCDGSESALLDCGTVKKWLSSSVIDVVCTGHGEATGKNGGYEGGM